jgi:hypothetical protein
MLQIHIPFNPERFPQNQRLTLHQHLPGLLLLIPSLHGTQRLRQKLTGRLLSLFSVSRKTMPIPTWKMRPLMMFSADSP